MGSMSAAEMFPQPILVGTVPERSSFLTKSSCKEVPMFIVTYIGDCLELVFVGIQIGIQISSAFHIIMIENGLEKAIKTHKSTCWVCNIALNCKKSKKVAKPTVMVATYVTPTPKLCLELKPCSFAMSGLDILQNVALPWKHPGVTVYFFFAHGS